MKQSKLRIIVTGLVGWQPVGGVAWDYLQYVIGLAELGHEVYYHEDTWAWPYNPRTNEVSESGDYSARFLESFFNNYAPELRHCWHYLHLHELSFGMQRSQFDKIARTADIFLNVSGAGLIPDNLSPTCKKVFLDSDPGFNQIVLSERPDWVENVESWCAGVLAHDQHFTYGENILGADCLVPKGKLTWNTTRMPIVNRLWEAMAPAEAHAPWTTVMTWNAFKGRLLYKGVEYKSKDAEFEKIFDLPSRLPKRFKVAVGGIKTPMERLNRAGWEAIDGPSATLTPESYQEYIVNSRGEVSTAKHVYVQLRTGWFSCRSACYLAAGRPVVVQDTGFSKFIPTGRGLHCFQTITEAVDCIRTVESDYEANARAAKELSKEYFDSGIVLQKLVDDIMEG
ncbi:MAG: hypothetical protein SH820_02645 [Xanthomonadales bacterium]|nr:hypothetical protein [Xanthomonadales bacterium]